ncbi:MAG: 2-oxoacid:acceptor oxidoreductase family protein [Alphaproteobacteria bacterium]|nr:2-oxoacid:acceptor oxidoreductase family protein [Alphaproteobacteria bacterium]MBV9695160.1 2-oxoacid:acceptor oxidoreductase family protein [Alphaproteobacteria bacterium]
MAERQRITLAVLALGGQGGGVLSDWLIDVGERSDWLVQATSVQGVAQRTGATIYYLEFFPEAALDAREPVLAPMPAPGDVDIVVASELMEAGRALLRGLVTPERTMLVTSTHRIYAIAEKSAPGDGTADSSKVLDAARRQAKALVAFDMQAACDSTGSAISAVMLGALAGSGALPFPRAAYEDAIRRSAIAVEANLAGFAAGFAGRDEAVPGLPTPLTLEDIVAEAERRLGEYQDTDYAALYRARLAPFAHRSPELRRELARTLALAMTYEDVMRVAQLKTRRAREGEIRAEVRAEPGQILRVTEYMHPRWQELCDTLPAGLGARLERNRFLRRLIGPLFERGRHVRTTDIGAFALLRLLASWRRARRATLRFARENARIESWLAAIRSEPDDALALELALAQDLLKGYGDTHARGMAKFETVIAAHRALRSEASAVKKVRALRQSLARGEDAPATSAASA